MAIHPLAERIPQSSAWRTTADSAFGAVDAFRGKIRDIKSDKRFSDQGHLEKIREAAKSGPLVYFAELRKQVATERKSLEKRRAHFELPVPDKEDLFSELRAQEVRRLLLSMPNIGERIKVAGTDPVIAAAVAHVPAIMSGLNEDGHARAKAFLLEHLYGPELATLRSEVEVMDSVAVALDVAETQLVNEYEPVRKVA